MAVVHTIDLKFQGIQGVIAAYAVPHSGGVSLVECGPGSTLAALQAGLSDLGYAVTDVSDVLLTHIHLDHAGSAGWWAQQGARIHVHPNGAAHLVRPDKLLTSARRVYGDRMDQLWGDFLPVPEDRLVIHQDDESIWVGGLCFRAIDSPGHAEHHFSYLMDGDLFTGDVGGVRVGGAKLLRLPTPPPEFRPEKWHKSLHRLSGLMPKRVLPTHFGAYEDPEWHIKAALDELASIEAWMEQFMPGIRTPDQIQKSYIDWSTQRLKLAGAGIELQMSLEAVNSSISSSNGIARFWNKYRAVL
jgi:glyoxylase-like metal-dependent hydrolase (beta-lactamase superfamily II)